MVKCEPGSRCRLISSCPAMMVLLARVKTGHREALNTLLASQCGFSKFMPKVCCPGVGGMEGRMGKADNITQLDTTMADNTIELETTMTDKVTGVETTTDDNTTKLDTTENSKPTRGFKKNFSRLNHPKCGIRTTIGFRVTFGASASSGQFPWIAALIYRWLSNTQIISGAVYCTSSN